MGDQLSKTPPVEKVCPSCGLFVLLEMDHCPQCGTTLVLAEHHLAPPRIALGRVALYIWIVTLGFITFWLGARYLVHAASDTHLESKDIAAVGFSVLVCLGATALVYGGVHALLVVWRQRG
jgi:ribosomal protein S27AE